METEEKKLKGKMKEKICRRGWKVDLKKGIQGCKEKRKKERQPTE